MIPRWAKGLLAAAGAVLFLAGCGSSAKPLPDLSSLGAVHAITREEGSGTKDQFEALTGSAGKGAAVTAASTEEAIAKTAADPGAVAYVSYSAAKEAKNVKILSVEGVAPSMETIRSDSYPLTRNYYLCWNAEPTPAAKDFLRYVDGARQAITEKYAIPLGHPTTFLSDKSAGTVRIAGSTSAAPLVRALAGDYMKINPDAVIEVTATDSTAGLTAAIESRADLAMSSRELKSYEAELLTKQAIAHDAVVLIVNEKNPLTTLTKDQIKGLYDGTWSEWKDMK